MANIRYISLSSRGFTLVELLIVIAILGLLATGSLVNLNPGGNIADTSDARRVSDISQLQIALDQYMLANALGEYPAALTSLAPTYMSTLPKDPEGTSYSYCRAESKKGYGLGIALKGSSANLTKIMQNSIALASMPVGCTTFSSFPAMTANTQCQAVSGTSNKNYCVARGT